MWVKPSDIIEESDEDETEAEIIDGILTFDDIIADPYYKAEFDKKIAEALNIKNSHSDVKGGTNKMDLEVQQSNEGEVKNTGKVKVEMQPQTETQLTEQPKTTVNPAVENTDAAQQDKTEEPTREPAHEMTAEQFDLYNETLRRVSKTAKASLPDRYNAFEDIDVKTLVKQKDMAGETPSVKELAADVVARMTKKAEPNEQKPNPEQQTAADANAELLELKAENALLKAGITTERLYAAKKLFIAEGAHFDMIAEFVAKYPEWHTQEGRSIVYSKAQPLSVKTAPNPGGQPVLNDYEAKVQALRKERGYKI